MIERMRSTGPPLSDEEITRAERRLKVTFPAPYRAFLLRYNGGRPSPDEFPVGHDASNVQMFYTIDDGRFNLFEQVAEIREVVHMPPEYLPIAHDDFGNIICLMLREPNRGRVYLWDHEAHDDEAFIEIASDFDAFLATFCDYLAERGL